jgi:replicative DNA helicase
MLTKIPPHNIELEQGILGGILLDSNILDEITEIIEEKDFYKNEHKIIFASFLSLSESRTVIDILSLSTHLDDSHQLEQAGGIDYISNIVESCASIANVFTYARMLKNKSLDRELIASAMSIGEIGYSETPTNEKIDQAQAIVMKIGESKAESGLTHADVISRQTIDKIEQRFNAGTSMIGLPTGFTGLDNLTNGFENGTFIVIAGRPSMGKSTLAANIAERAAIRDKSVMVFNLEMPRESVMMRSYSSIGSVLHDRVRSGQLRTEDWPKLTSAVARLKNKPLWIDDTPGITVEKMRSRLRRRQRDIGKKIDLIVLDYMQIMGGGGARDNPTSRITEISRCLKAIAKEFDCPLIALSQLNRGVENRTNKRPMMSDLRESGAIEQDADIILMMYRDEYYNEDSKYKGIAEIICTKQRNGGLGTVHVGSELHFSRFVDFTGTIPTDDFPENNRAMDKYFKK